jgi:Tfp pilus assembly protein PilN
LLMAARKKTINLLPQDPFEASVLGKFLKWALSVGRYIVIGTELVVIGSFLTRFSLDRQVTDLNEAIAQRQAVIESYGEVEEEFRSWQERLTKAKELLGQQLEVETQLEKVSSFTPVDVFYSNLSLSEEKVEVEGMAFSEAGFSTFLQAIKQDEAFSKIDVERISTEGMEGAGIDFKITALLKSAEEESDRKKTN